MKFKIRIYAFILVIFYFLFQGAQLYARAGGGGDYGGGASGDDGWFLGIIFFVLSFAPYPYNLWILGVLAVIFVFGWLIKKAKK